jgi:Fur family peroxide stress response transcriptional regulator
VRHPFTGDQRIEALRPLLRERGLALTPQRRAIFLALIGLDEHPTADRVHAVLRRRGVSVSRATVFRALEAFARVGAIAKASHHGMASRFDGRTDRHHHLVCTRCDRVIDFSDTRLDALPVPDTRRLGFLVSDYQVHVRGTCQQCREQEERA